MELRVSGESRLRALETLDGDRTYPRTYPTIDITAEDRVYLSLAVNHASVSGNISMNHSWRTGGSLQLCQYSELTGDIDTEDLLGQNVSGE